MSTHAAHIAAPSQLRAPRRTWAGPDLVLVANGSASGVGRSSEALSAARSALRARGARVEAHRTESLAELADAWPDFSERRVALLGGDGTVHAAANLPRRPSEIAILPAGRANNVARALGIPLDLGAAAELAAEGRPRPLDLITATADDGTTRFAVEGVSVGLHALARAGYRSPNSADIRAAIRTGVDAVRRFGGVTLCVASDGVAELLTVGQLFVANLPLYAFGLRVAPRAQPDDGLLDVISLAWQGRARVVPTVLRLRRGTHLGRPGARAWTAASVRVATRGQSPVIADTVSLGTGPVTLAVEPASFPVVAP
jgi:diacylglycerol kinase (ATP)